MDRGRFFFRELLLWSRVVEQTKLVTHELFMVTPSQFAEIFGIRRLESLGYRAALFAHVFSRFGKLDFWRTDGSTITAPH